MAGPEFPLRYMPFLEHMLNVLARSFGEMTALPLADKLAFVENPEKGARMLRCVASRCRPPSSPLLFRTYNAAATAYVYLIYTGGNS